MEKSFVVQQVLTSAYECHGLIQNSKPVDTNNLCKWVEALLRYVLHELPIRTEAQSIENLVRQFVAENLDATVPFTQARKTLDELVCEVREITVRMRLDDKIEYESPFDSNPYMRWEPQGG